MEFGLWVEPEMVNPDSDLVPRAPRLGAAARRAGCPRAWRHQQVLDLAHPEACAHVLEQLNALLTDIGIDYLKWDHNRDLLEAGRTDAAGHGPPAVHAQTLAVYRLLDELRAAPPRSSRSSRAPAAAPGSTSASWRAPTGSGPATATTPSSGQHPALDRRCSCRPS